MERKLEKKTNLRKASFLFLLVIKIPWESSHSGPYLRCSFCGVSAIGIASCFHQAAGAEQQAEYYFFTHCFFSENTQNTAEVSVNYENTLHINIYHITPSLIWHLYSQ